MFDLSKVYERNNFLNYLKGVLNLDIIEENIYVSKNSNINAITKIANIDLDEKFDLYEVEHNSKKDPRVELTKNFFSILNKFSIKRALVIFFCKDSDKYRFSLIESSLIWKDEINVKRQFSHPKRLSFLLGVGSKTHTPFNQLKKKISNIKDLKKRFDKEVVTEEFFENYERLYLDLLNKLRKDKNFVLHLKKIRITKEIFAKKLMGQVIFCYFLQKKGWLGAPENERIEKGDKNFLRNKFIEFNDQNLNYYNNFLEYLFYEGLNQKNKDQLCSSLKCKIPFLNGGLFEEMKNYDWKSENIKIPNEIFSNKDKNGILDIFDLYNFTVDESSDYDVEIAIDPEMLGKVFESLIPENIKKKHGVFYTNRSIVSFMCRDALVSYLYSQLNYKISKKDFMALFYIANQKKFLNSENLPLKIKKYSNVIDFKLKNLKICDPEVGSGAYPISMMNEVCRTRSLLQFKKKRKSSELSLKKNFIKNCLYAVDIDPGSVEIAKLRLWLSLIVDEKSHSEELILPNLDFKIIEANALKNFPIDIFSYADYNNLIDLKDRFFKETNSKEKIILKNKIDNFINNLKKADKFDFRIVFFEIFKSNKEENCGFDIIICNPPYIGEKESKLEIEKIKSSDLHKNYIRKMDYFYFFFHLAISIMKPKGIASFITTNYYITATQGTKLRQDLKQNSQILSLINFNEYKVFRSAKGQHNLITSFTKDQNYKQKCKTIFTKRTGDATDYDLDNLFFGNDSLDLKKEIASDLIFEGPENYIRLDGKTNDDGSIQNKILNKILHNSKPLVTYYDVNQGLITGVDKIKKNHISKFKKEKFKLGSGVFVLSSDEIDKIKFNKNEQKLLKPYFKNSDIDNFYIKDNIKNFVLYLTRDLNLDNYPNIKKHVHYFEKVIKSRGTARGEIQAALKLGKWWVIFAARNKNIFEKDKIVCPQRSRINKFAFTKEDFFASADVYFITNKKNYPLIDELFSLNGILNSKLFYFWFKKKGKVKGEMLELFYKPLCEVPVKELSNNNVKDIKNLLNQINITNNKIKNQKVIDELNKKIYHIYDLDKDEITFIENFYPNDSNNLYEK